MSLKNFLIGNVFTVFTEDISPKNKKIHLIKKKSPNKDSVKREEIIKTSYFRPTEIDDSHE